MAIKIKLTDGTVFEGTAEEIAELQRLTGGKIGDKPKCKEEEENDDKLKVYDARGNEIKEGDRVKLQVKGEPEYGWGEVSNGEIGTVFSVLDDRIVKVDFPSQGNWYALPNELINLSAEPSFDLSVGDYAKVTGLTVFGDITEGSYVKIVEDIASQGKYKIKLIDDSNYDSVEPEALEKVELTDRELTFLKAGRKPGEFKVGDLVEVIDYHDTIPKNSIVEIVKKYSDGDVLTKRTEGTMSYLFEPKHLKLIAPVEARVDR